jgi:hypothetical protein
LWQHPHRCVVCNNSSFYCAISPRPTCTSERSLALLVVLLVSSSSSASLFALLPISVLHCTRLPIAAMVPHTKSPSDYDHNDLALLSSISTSSLGRHRLATNRRSANGDHVDPPQASATMLSPAPPQAPEATAAGLPKKTRRVASACLNCRYAKVACSGVRPCARCVTRQCEDSCMDVPRRPRTTKRKIDNTLPATPSSVCPFVSVGVGVGLLDAC